MLHRRTALAIVAVLVVAAIAAFVAVPSETQLARRAEQALSDRLGVPVHIGRLRWQLLPVPMIEVFDAATEQDEPIAVRHLSAWPRLGRLLHRELAFDRVVLDGGSFPQLSFKAFKGRKVAPKEGGAFHLAPTPVGHAEFRDAAWVGRRKISLVFEGTVDFDPAWRPREASVRMPEAPSPARLDLHRIEGQDRWKADIAVADGSWNGILALQQPAPGSFHITGELDPSGVELRQLLETFKRNPVIAGRASGHSTLRAEGATLGEIVQSLQTRTRFSVSPATVLRFDLDRAIHSLGKEHAGTTPLQTLSGVLDTQNDPAGIVMRYGDLKATSGALSASGTVVLQDRKVDADIVVDLVNGVVGVPLKITGPVTDPRYSVPPGAIAGAAVGTAVLPGVGTVLGARIGDAIGKIFGGPKAGDRKTAPSGPPSSR